MNLPTQKLEMVDASAGSSFLIGGCILQLEHDLDRKFKINTDTCDIRSEEFTKTSHI